MKKSIITLSLFFFAFFFVSVPHIYAQTCSNTPTSGDTVTATFSVPENNTYVVWTRILARDVSNNSIYLQVDNGCAVNVGDSSSIPANQFTWVNYQDGNTASPVLLTLTGGTHTLKLTERESGVGIDRIIITTNTVCVPDGIGDNCPIPTSTPIVFNTPTPTASAAATNTPVPPMPTLTPTSVPVSDTIRPTVSIISPTNGSTVTRNKTVTISANATDNVAVRQVQFAISGKGGNSSCTDTSYPYTCNWLVPSKPSTQYTITASATDTSGNTNAVSINVTSSR